MCLRQASQTNAPHMGGATNRLSNPQPIHLFYHECDFYIPATDDFAIALTPLGGGGRKYEGAGQRGKNTISQPHHSFLSNVVNKAQRKKPQNFLKNTQGGCQMFYT